LTVDEAHLSDKSNCGCDLAVVNFQSQQMKTSLSILSLALASTVFLSACGGGDSGANGAVGITPQTPSVNTAEAVGLWSGRSGEFAGIRSTTLLVLADGNFFHLYSRVDRPTELAGLIHGVGTLDRSSLRKTDAIDFNFEGGMQERSNYLVSAMARLNVTGSVDYVSATFSKSFTATYNTDFDGSAVLADINRNYSGNAYSVKGTQAAVISIDASGGLLGSSGGTFACSFTGRARPRSDSKVFDVNVTFTGSGCAYPNQTFAGIAFVDKPTKGIAVMVTNPSHDQAVVFSGS
jgi:hypothetical protein